MLFDFLFKKKPKVEINRDIFNLHIRYKDNNLYIEAKCDEQSDSSVVATALYMLNNGELSASILDSLLKGNDSIHYHLFLNKVLIECNNLINTKTNHYNTNDPIIRPSDVFIKKHEKQ